MNYFWEDFFAGFFSTLGIMGAYFIVYGILYYVLIPGIVIILEWLIGLNTIVLIMMLCLAVAIIAGLTWANVNRGGYDDIYYPL